MKNILPVLYGVVAGMVITINLTILLETNSENYEASWWKVGVASILVVVAMFLTDRD